MLGRALLYSLECSTLLSIHTLYCWVLSKAISSTIFWVFGKTQPGTEPRSTGPLANTLLIYQPHHVSRMWYKINGPVVITWIGREHGLYSSASPISLIEHCVTFRHDRRLLSLLGFVHNWPTSRWSATKKEKRYSLNGNGIMSSFLGWQFYRSTLYSINKRGLNVNLTAKVLSLGKLIIEINILPVFIVIGRVHYSP